MIVIENPMQVTMVKAVPLISNGTDCAANVENCGESATTENPHIRRINKNKAGCK